MAIIDTEKYTLTGSQLKDLTGKVKTTLNQDLASKEYVDNAVSTKQDTLVSGTNIKTINGNSLVGEGNLAISEIPKGGKSRYTLIKKSDQDGDLEWDYHPSWYAPEIAVSPDGVSMMQSADSGSYWSATFTIYQDGSGVRFHGDGMNSEAILASKKYVNDSLANKQDILTAGEGIEITNSTIAVKDPVKERELTQAEYDALSDEEKNNGTTYYVTDGQGGSNSSSSSSSSNITRQEFNEKATGYVVDNKIFFVVGEDNQPLPQRRGYPITVGWMEDNGNFESIDRMDIDFDELINNGEYTCHYGGYQIDLKFTLTSPTTFRAEWIGNISSNGITNDAFFHEYQRVPIDESILPEELIYKRCTIYSINKSLSNATLPAITSNSAALEIIFDKPTDTFNTWDKYRIEGICTAKFSKQNELVDAILVNSDLDYQTEGLKTYWRTSGTTDKQVDRVYARFIFVPKLPE